MSTTKPSRLFSNDTRRIFLQKASCSHAFFHLLSREFGYLKEHEARASRPLAGGVVRRGHQCGMLSGAVLAVGAESFRRCENKDEAIGLAIMATQQLIESFTQRTGTVNCREITKTDFSKKLDMTKYVIFKAKTCLNLADQWVPEAIQSAKDGLSLETTHLPKPALSCASEVAKRMGASDEEMVMVAGFAGGLGLSGEACGALSAAIWLKALAKNKAHKGRFVKSSEDAKKQYEAFYQATHADVLCEKLTGQCFKSVSEHSEFIKNGGCEARINRLASEP